MVFTDTASMVIVTTPLRQVITLSFSEEPGLSDSVLLSVLDHLFILQTQTNPESPLSTLGC